MAEDRRYKQLGAPLIDAVAIRLRRAAQYQFEAVRLDANSRVPAGQAQFPELLHVQDQKNTSTNGGTATLGAWRTRDLNTVVTNEITGASLASNQITLPAGDYFIIARAPAYDCNAHTTRLLNTDDTVVVLEGSAQNSDQATGASVTESWIIGQFTLAAEKALEIQHRVQSTKSTNGFGAASGFNTNEIYTEAAIWKVG